MEASKTINLLKWKLAEVFEEDADGFMDEVDSLQLITYKEYIVLCGDVSPTEKTLRLIELILHKGEEACMMFLHHLENMIPRFPPLSQVSRHFQDCKTKTFEVFLLELGLDKKRSSKLTLRDVLSLSNPFNPKTPADLPHHFLRNIIALDRSARNTELYDDLSDQGSSVDDDLFDMFNSKTANSYRSNSLHPLDVLCAVLHCSDKSLQQEIISKMSVCQFAVPLLLPAGDGPNSTLMLWAMRDIVKKWRPQSLADSKGFREDNVVNIEMPIFSFVRLGPNKLSKSKILNQVLNPAQQHHDFFIHDNMEGGNIERRISDGLVEMSWYFPCGKSDVFSEPISVANLRGDLENNLEKFTFLTRISSATFVFLESMCERQYRLLSTCCPNDTKFYFIVSPGKDKAVDPETRTHIQNLLPLLKIERTNVILKTAAVNEAEFMNKVKKIMNCQLKTNPKLIRLKDITEQASNLNIDIDEASPELRTSRDYAVNITSMIENVEMFKNESLRLQGVLWRQLSKLEKEFCRMTKQGGEDQQKYISNLKEKRNLLLRQQNEHALTEAMALFISAITHLSQNEKQHFLKWMKFDLDSIARKNLSKLQAEYKEKCENLDASADPQELKQLDKRISESSLGIEHFLRELGQIYEAEYSTVKNKKKQFKNLPGTAADLLLDGFPLELIDGDASNIPLQWITDVLTELDKKTGGNCRMRVITVLGVQSTGKSTLLNTMFGLQFPVASGRCTRGAFMTLIKVKENFQEEIGCKFILVIDTEGLKAQELASLDDSYEHDNELATLVVGLSDITIVNMAMENTSEMKDILQIVVHAFLRMKEVGKKPNCQFVHQNVSDLSAHDKNMRDRKKLLEQLDEMTKVAAKMEKKSGFDKFSHVMDYDLDKHNWYIPGLWQGVPPMAPVNPGYSEHVSELKKYLLQFLKTQKIVCKALTIPDFCKWITELWTAVKHEKFIFSFRNSLVAEAYNKLSMKFSLWEWDFTKEVHKWVVRKETNIKNQSTHNLDKKKNETIKDLDQLLHDEEKKMVELVEKYYDSESENINLIERYREEFKKSVTSLRQELRRNAIDKYEKALSIRKGNLKIQDMKEKYQELIEEKIDGLLKTCRDKNNELSEGEVEGEFNAMWEKTLSELHIEKLKKCNVSDAIFRQLRQDMSNKGPDINKALLAVVKLTDYGTNFNIDNTHIDLHWRSKKWKQFWGTSNEPYEKLEDLATSLLEMCDSNVTEMENTNEDYDDTYCQQIIQMINTKLEDEESKKLHFTVRFELDIKLFIFGKASKRFQLMHDRFIRTNDPRTCMENLKPDYWNIFLDVFKAKDESQSRGRQFCEKCLTPAITDYVYNHLGRIMVDDILHGSDNQIFKSRSFFQYNLLKNLLGEMSFQKYVQYIKYYEKFSKDWILNKISEIYQKQEALEKLQADLISSISRDVKEILREDTTVNSDNIPQFLEDVQKKLKEKLVISQTTMKIISFNNDVNVRQFSSDIQSFLDSTEEQVLSDLKSMSFDSLLSKIKLKPQDELFRKVIGCGHQCPFCKVPCEAGGGDHKEHFASIHRPKGLGRYKWSDTKILTTYICSTSVVSEARFRNADTDGKYHPYKEYRTYYPEWSIQPDPSIESSDYWKYVFAYFNKEFAEKYEAKPADLPNDWKKITVEGALNGLKKTFNVC